MKLRTMALSGLMAATLGMGLTACDSHKEEAVESVNDAQEELQDAQQELQEAQADGQVVSDEAAQVADAQAAANQAEVAVASGDAEAVDEADNLADHDAMATADTTIGNDPAVVVVDDTTTTN